MWEEDAFVYKIIPPPVAGQPPPVWAPPFHKIMETERKKIVSNFLATISAKKQGKQSNGKDLYIASI